MSFDIDFIYLIMHLYIFLGAKKKNTEQIPVCATVDVGEKKGLSYKWISAFGNPGILLVSKNIFLETINSTFAGTNLPVTFIRRKNQRTG